MIESRAEEWGWVEGLVMTISWFVSMYLRLEAEV